MKLLFGLFQSSLGKKFIMAGTGGGLFLFVVAHLAGNLQVFLGPEVINRYGHFLQSNLEIIWPARIGLLLMVGLHVWSAIRLSAENKAARPIGYEDEPTPVAASYASRTMLMSGLIIAAFIIYHLLHFTVQARAVNFVANPETRDFTLLTDVQGRHDVQRMMVVGFQVPLVSGFYILAIGLLCLHLSHGMSAMFQSLGLTTPAYKPVIEKLARLVAWAIFLGYASIPIAVLAGVVK